MNDGTIRVAEMFAGIGGFRLGLERASPRFKVVYANDWKHARQEYNPDKNNWIGEENKSGEIYQKQWKDQTYHDANICQVQAKDIPDCELLIGGFPCQPFSMAGKREGFSDIRGTLFFEIARILQHKRPKVLLLENVKGLLSAQSGFCYLSILSTLDELGYNVEWKVLNTKNWLPQNRERVFIVGHLREGSSRQVYPFPSYDAASDEVGEVAGTLQGGGHSGGLHSNMTAVVVADRTRSYAGLGRNLESPKPIANTLSSVAKDNLLLTVSNAVDTTGWLRKNGHHIPGLHGLTDYRLRRFTPREAERLQGFPDDWTEGICNTQRFHCLGNAVSVPVITYLGQLIAGVCD